MFFRFRPPIYILSTFEFRKSFMRSRKNSRAKLPIEVRQSRVHGRGVFATNRIRKNARIIEYTGKRVPWESVPADSGDAHAFLFGLDDSVLVIDPSIEGNDARWINHSCDPNCEAIEEDDRIFIYALRNIETGEELFYDYALKLDEPITKQLKDEFACHCGSPNCRGTLVELV
jgi:SET domain-containing protein